MNRRVAEWWGRLAARWPSLAVNSEDTKDSLSNLGDVMECHFAVKRASGGALGHHGLVADIDGRGRLGTLSPDRDPAEPRLPFVRRLPGDFHGCFVLLRFFLGPQRADHWPLVNR